MNRFEDWIINSRSAGYILPILFILFGTASLVLLFGK